MEVLMDFLGITIITIALLLLFIAPTIIKRVYLKRRYERLMREYNEILNKSYEYTILMNRIQPNNVISIEEYKNRTKNKDYKEL